MADAIYDVRNFFGFFDPLLPPVTVTNQLILFLLSAFWGPHPLHCGRHTWKPPCITLENNGAVVFIQKVDRADKIEKQMDIRETETSVLKISLNTHNSQCIFPCSSLLLAPDSLFGNQWASFPLCSSRGGSHVE